MKKYDHKQSIILSNVLNRQIYSAGSWRRFLQSMPCADLFHDRFVAMLLGKYHAFGLPPAFGIARNYWRYTPLAFDFALPLRYAMPAQGKMSPPDFRFQREDNSQQFFYKYSQQVLQPAKYSFPGAPVRPMREFIRLVQQGTATIGKTTFSPIMGSDIVFKHFGHQILPHQHQANESAKQRGWQNDTSSPELRYAFPGDLTGREMPIVATGIVSKEKMKDVYGSEATEPFRSISTNLPEISSKRQLSPPPLLQNRSRAILSPQIDNNLKRIGIVGVARRNQKIEDAVVFSNKESRLSHIENRAPSMKSFQTAKRESLASHTGGSYSDLGFIHRRQHDRENDRGQETTGAFEAVKKQTPDANEVQHDAAHHAADSTKAMQTLRPVGIAEPLPVGTVQNIDLVADEVVKIIEKKLKTERERRGIFL